MMMIEFKTSGAAFEEYSVAEIKKILKSIVDRVECGCTSGVIMDINGNKIGWWRM